jgi:hypothetical protein
MSQLAKFDYATAPAYIKAAYDLEIATRGNVTNMKHVLLQSLPAHNIYLDWFALAEVLHPALGNQSIWLFSLAISNAYPSKLCALYFRKALINSGVSPETHVPSEDEALLMEFGAAIARDSNAVPPDLWVRVKARYDEPLLVNLVAFAGLMVSQIIFANAVGIEIDEGLKPYLPPA